MEYEIIPAILAEDLEEFNEKLELAEDFAETVQWDIMDGQFVEAMTFSDPDDLSEADTTLSIEAHLMVENPEEMFDQLAEAGIDRVIIHAETVDSLEDTVNRMDQFSFEKGVAISPETEIAEIEAVLDKVDMVLVMTVVPGASGQGFMDDQLEKVSELRSSYPNLNIGVDGGVNINSILRAKEAGANRFGVNSAIFESPDPAHAFEVLKGMIS